MDQDLPSDSSLIERVLSGDRAGFRELVMRYQPQVYRVAVRLVGNPQDAEDMTQQSFVEAFCALHRFDRRRRFGTWLLRIAVNNCKDHLKSHKRRERQLAGDVDGQAALFAGQVDEPERAAVRRQRLRQVAAALDGMDPRYAIPLVLKDVEGLSYSEMAAVLDLPVTTLKIRVVRARGKLQEQMSWTSETS